MNTTQLWPDGPIYSNAEHMPLTTDSILLADFAAVRSGEKGADLGCASGLLMLLLLWRENGLRMSGLELLPEAVRLAEENLRANGLEGRGSLICGDLRETVKTMPNGSFDFIIANPPYWIGNAALPEARRHCAFPSSARRHPDCAAAGDGSISATVRSGFWRLCRRCENIIWSRSGFALFIMIFMRPRLCC